MNFYSRPFAQVKNRQQVSNVGIRNQIKV